MGKKGIRYFQYFVEGEDEKKLIDTLKSDMELVKPGKVQVFNCVRDRLTQFRLLNLKDGTATVLVFDTDAGSLEILEENVRLLREQSNISDVICVMQVKNLEEELVRACRLKQIKELLGVESNSEYKRAFIKEKNLGKKLIEKGFDMTLFWCRQDNGIYKSIPNEAQKVKK